MTRVFGILIRPGSLLWTVCVAAAVGAVFLAGNLFFYPSTRAAPIQSLSGAAAFALVSFVLLARLTVSDETVAIITRRVLVLGIGDDAVMVKETLDDSGHRGILIVGFYSIDAGQQASAAIPAAMILPHSVPLEAIVRQKNVTEIVLATRDRRGGTLPLTDLLNCKLQGIKVTDLSSFLEQYDGKVRIDLLRESWFIFGDGFRQQRSHILLKRAFDIVASSVLLVVSLPVMLLTALAIRLESSGPVIYRQERVGLGGKLFDVLKFRSMRTDAEEDGKPQWAQADDARVTRVGHFLRLTRIDELPQLINVLAGQMSLVGPRPERPYFVEQLIQQIPFYDARHSVKPGVTGWAQVRHHYGASVTDSSDKLQYDLYYVKNQTLVFDIVVLVLSVRVVLFAQGSR